VKGALPPASSTRFGHGRVSASGRGLRAAAGSRSTSGGKGESEKGKIERHSEHLHNALQDRGILCYSLMTAGLGEGSVAVPSDDSLVAVHSLGGTGPPLLFFAANGFHSMAYQPLVRLLSDVPPLKPCTVCAYHSSHFLLGAFDPVQANTLRNHFFCLGVDLRGQGDTGASDGDLVHLFTRDLMAVLDHLMFRGQGG
jgi:hypothetical protein